MLRPAPKSLKQSIHLTERVIKQTKKKYERKKGKGITHWKNNAMTGLNKHLTTIPFNVSGLNSPIKRPRLAE